MHTVLRDLEACVADHEWERAAVYFDDLHALALGQCSSARLLGAVLHTMLGLQRALDRHDAGVAIASLRHLGYLADEVAQPQA
jgi:hypothetical protein